MAGFAPLITSLLAASFLDRVPGLAFGVPLLVAASFVFAATHHENQDAIRSAMLQWLVWLGVILGAVLAVVLLIGMWV
jgi:pheromone shutdown protein TraB